MPVDKAMKATVQEGKDFAEILTKLPEDTKANIAEVISEFAQGHPGKETDPAMMAIFENMLKSLRNITPNQIKQFLNKSNYTDEQRTALTVFLMSIQTATETQQEELLNEIKRRGFNETDLEQLVNHLAGSVTPHNTTSAYIRQQIINNESSILSLLGGITMVTIYYIMNSNLHNGIIPGTNIYINALAGGALFGLGMIIGKKILVLTQPSFKNDRKDKAMRQEENGGIDLNAAQLSVDLKQSKGFEYNVDPAMLEQFINAPGVVSVITNIQVIPNLPMFLGFATEENKTKQVALKLSWLSAKDRKNLA
ncbi:MAG: hypothetical protein HQL25_04385 [Candidatus Omnitrophica bacterium]|nr:hypothetical protein [Candidatus Omnitrophota bacterium]